MKEIAPVALAKMLANGEAVVVDVRENDEFSEEHIANAISIPLSVFAQKFDPKSFPEGKEVVLQCRGGVRSLKACEMARQLSEDYHVANLTGGLNAWKSAGLPVTK